MMTSKTTMKAIRLHEFGGPEVLQLDEVPIPAPGADEVLVRVHAVGLNPPDWYLREGYPNLSPEWRAKIAPLPVTPGSDVSGVVQAVGSGVANFSVGDEVFGMLRFPSFGESAAYAEYVTAPASDLAHKPAGIDHLHAAAAPMSALTAWQFLVDVGHHHPNPLQAFPHHPVPLTSGMSVLVNGAAGGVGHLAVQLAKWKGARVIAVASGKHEAFLRELGADQFIDYTQTQAEQEVRDVDLVLDAIGGKGTTRFLPTLKRGGALYPVFLTTDDLSDATRLGVTVSMTQVRSSGVQLSQLGKLLDDGRLRVKIDSCFPLADARLAHERAANGHIQGKIVLKVV